MCLKRKKDTPLDLEALLKSFDGDAEFVDELITEFVKTALEFPKSIKSSAGDYTKISALAHTIKGIAANMMCKPLSQVSAELELYTKRTKRISKQKVERRIRLVLFEIGRVVSQVSLNSRVDVVA